MNPRPMKAMSQVISEPRFKRNALTHGGGAPAAGQGGRAR